MSFFSKTLLSPLSVIYGTLMFIRNKLYDLKILKSKQFNLPIISVGNLTLGGTGKTPHTEYLIRLLQNKHNLTTLSRGYKRKTKGFYLAQNNTTVSEIGDEPLQYKVKFNKINVAVDEKRVHGVQQILKKIPKTNLIILDDAFQHRAISPGMNILITEYNNLYIDDYVIPSGRLREWKKGSERADIIIISKTHSNLTQLEKNKIYSKLKPKTYQKIYFSFIKYKPLTPFSKSAKDFKNKISKKSSILLLTGIAKPDRLFNSLKKEYSKINHIQFSDHHNYTNNDIELIIKKFKEIDGNNKFIISTEKDIMRLSLPQILNQLQDIPIFYIPIEICFHGNDKIEFDEQIIKYVSKNQ
ncbi:MAG: tetraacyldisaccharide 4'-kinase [Vicingaceae bacterium]|nr:tetraacyldisaccharide 4'-kinase [Vicingaceae bacterium]